MPGGPKTRSVTGSSSTRTPSQSNITNSNGLLGTIAIGYRIMKSGKLTFDGFEFPDGAASDPNDLGWMRGAPPPPERWVRFQDDRFLGFPQIRWSLSHMRQLLPTVAIWRGDAARDAPPAVDTATAGAIDALSFEDLTGSRVSWEQSLLNTYTDGILVLHRGQVVYERYFGALRPHLPHSCFSITKSYAATLATALICEGTLDPATTVGHYLPELQRGAFGDATLRDVLDMQVGVSYSEEYADAEADVWKYGRAGGLRPRGEGYTGPSNYYEYLATLKQEGPHGAQFVYKTVNTEVLCWVMKRVTGVSFEDMLSERLWSPLGCAEDGYIAVDSIGVAMGGGGMSATLRDMAKFGELMRCDGAWGGRQLLPAAAVADIRGGGDPGKFAPAGYTLLPGYSYRSMWWITHNPLGAFEGRGIHGQRLYVAPGAETVIARFASHPIAASAANDTTTLPAFAALCRLLQRG
jgi:CubicO group peptidase (beta-lactamase class C family)